MKLDSSLWDCYKGLAGWRWPVYLMSIYTPMVFVTIEFFLNQIEIPPRVALASIGVSLLYLGNTYIGQYLLSQPIYPSIVDWTNVGIGQTNG